ncbi:RICIN domain-containing protein [Kitasatospora sp. NPDC059327]|uniref:RICIN domain-containing protein n=1 Tax=Kitasatospora sp. NPDC059327 TaxID=3346803 RepID=UPI0036CAD0ED
MTSSPARTGPARRRSRFAAAGVGALLALCAVTTSAAAQTPPATPKSLYPCDWPKGQADCAVFEVGGHQKRMLTLRDDMRFAYQQVFTTVETDRTINYAKPANFWRLAVNRSAGTFQIVSRTTGQCVDSRQYQGDGSYHRVLAAACDSKAKSQQWYGKASTDASFTIRNAESGKCLSGYDPTKEPLAVRATDCWGNGAPEQRWSTNVGDELRSLYRTYESRL